MAANSKDSSQYLLTPITNWYLDLWVPREVPKSDFDKIVIIPPEYDQRPDLMSNAEYGTPRLWWVFSIRNPDLIIDPINDFVAGLEIFVPANILKQ
jgi:hypothetical protein